MLSISHNSTRDALRILENMGVIESKQGSVNYIVGKRVRLNIDTDEESALLDDIACYIV